MNKLVTYSPEDVSVTLTCEGEKVEITPFCNEDFVLQVGGKVTIFTLPLHAQGVYEFCEKYFQRKITAEISIFLNEDGNEKTYVKVVEGDMVHSLRVGMEGFPQIKIEIYS